MKSYTKTVEEENDKLREKITELDIELENSYESLKHQSASVNITLRYSMSDFCTDYGTEMLMNLHEEDDAICEVLNHLESNIINGGERAWECILWEKNQKGLINAKPTWMLDYWFYGMRFNWVKIQLNKKKKYFFGIYSSPYDMSKNFKYGLDAWERRKMLDVIKPQSEIKSKLYMFINESRTLKHLFTPHK